MKKLIFCAFVALTSATLSCKKEDKLPPAVTPAPPSPASADVRRCLDIKDVRPLLELTLKSVFWHLFLFRDEQ